MNLGGPSIAGIVPLYFSARGTRYSHLARAERLIATGRAILAGLSLVAISLDPSEPSRHAGVTYAILTGYVTYAVIVAVVVWRAGAPHGLFGILSHAFDLLIFSIILFFTLGPSSPFFVFFVFSIVCATLRWQWQGALWTTVAALSAVVGMALYPTDLLRDPDFEMNRFIMRVVYLAVVGSLLGYVGAHEQTRRRELSRLAAWPHGVPGDLSGLARQSLEYAAAILAAPRMLLAWEEHEEPWLHLASWERGAFEYTREAPDALGTLVAEPLAGRSFFCVDAKSAEPNVVYFSPTGLQRSRVVPLRPEMQARVRAKVVLALSLQGEAARGYLFALDKTRMTSDDLVLGEITARGVATRLDHFYLLQQLRDAAAAEERVRLARDLHDGVLQSLTAAALNLETAQRLVDADPQGARERLRDIQRVIAAEQRDLRTHIEQLKPPYSRGPHVNEDLAGRFRELAGQIERQWSTRIEMDLGAQAERFPAGITQHLYFILHEALINAARHARASCIRAEIGLEAPDRLRIVVADDGCGFPFHGRHDHAALNAMKAGPVTLRERIASLGGSLTIDSSSAGSRLEITLPLPGKGG